MRVSRGLGYLQILQIFCNCPLIQKFLPGNDARAVKGNGGSKNFKGPLHHFLDRL